MELVVHCDADALLALTHAEGAAQVNFLLQAVVRDELLELLNHLTGTLDMAGTTDAHCDFQNFDLLKECCGGIL